MNTIKNSHSWVDIVDPKSITLYPIQFTNCDRLQKNDAVFIFDEVGSGKTISSGLMALDYLYQNNDKNVLVITANALVRTESAAAYGQFLKDWYDKLPFQTCGFDSKIEIINQDYRNLSKKRDVGLLIIDEAHTFLSTVTKRYTNLVQNIRAEKIIFLTATPIKSNTADLYTYVNIARKITGKNIDDSWINEINTSSKEPHEIICSRFDPTYPVTRYFKDTIMSINKEGFRKTKARRLLPEMWFYGMAQNKLYTMLEHINDALDKNAESRFVIFTRFVDKEAYEIFSFMCSNGFTKFESHNSNIKKTVQVVTGQNAYKLEEFTGITRLPTVLILTYQIAEQGVNLPGFNYVVNYHIPAYPSALEQRFGRIDRMGKNGSIYDEIHISFLISDSGWDSNALNFYTSVSIYIRELLSYLPSKNTILSPEIIQQFKVEKTLAEDYVSSLQKCLKDNTQINAIQTFYNCDDVHKDVIRKQCNNDLLNFIDEYAIEIDTDKKFVDAIRKRLRELVSDFNKIDDNKIDSCMNVIKKISDNIFYGNVMTEEGIKSINAVDDCGKFISECDAFKIYNETFNRSIKVSLVIKQISPWINKHFENYFINNQFHKLFPLLGYTDVFSEIFTSSENFFKEFPDANEDIVKLICEQSEKIAKSLPFFKMCEYFKKTIQGYLWTNEGSYRQKFDFNPFGNAVYAVGIWITTNEDYTGLSHEFVRTFWSALSGRLESEWAIDKYCDLFYFQTNSDNVTQISNWYKLAYQYLRRESQYFEKNYGFWENRYGKMNVFSLREQKLIAVSEVFIHCDKDEVKYNQKLNADQIKDYVEQDIIPRLYKSDFYSCVFTGSKNLREYFKCSNMHCYNPYKCTVYKNDLWTQGVLYELYGLRYDSVWGDVIPLPSYFAKYPLY